MGGEGEDASIHSKESQKSISIENMMTLSSRSPQLTSNIMTTSPISRKSRSTKELFVGILFVDVLLVKVGQGELFAQDLRSGDQLNLGVIGVVDEGRVL